MSDKFLSDLDLNLMISTNKPMNIITIGGRKKDNVRINTHTDKSIGVVCTQGAMHVFPWRAIECISEYIIEESE